MVVEITRDIFEALKNDPDPFVALGAPIAVERGVLRIVDRLPAAAPGVLKGVA